MKRIKPLDNIVKYFALKIFEYCGKNEDIKKYPELHLKKREYIKSIHSAVDKVLQKEKFTDKTVRSHNDNKNKPLWNYFVFIGDKPPEYEGFTKKDIGMHLEGDSLDNMILSIVDMYPPHGAIREFRIKNDYDYIFAKLIVCDIVRDYIYTKQNSLKNIK
jgi:hypothetical protein